MYKGEIGKIEGVRFIQSTNAMKEQMPIVKTGKSSICAYFCTIVGKNALGVTEMEGGVKTTVKQANRYDTYNPLNQWSTIGWKVTLAARVLNCSCGIHIFSIVTA